MCRREPQPLICAALVALASAACGGRSEPAATGGVGGGDAPAGGGGEETTKGGGAAGTAGASGGSGGTGGGGAPGSDAAAARGPERPTDAGAPDARTTDASSGGCSARLCEDFERYGVGAAPAGGWTLMARGGASAVVDETRAFSGTRSVLFRAPIGSSSAFIVRGAPALPVPGNDLYGRMMVYLARSPMGEVHWNSVCAWGKLPSGASQAYCYGGHFQQFLANYRPANDCWKGSKTAFPTGRWSCLQWRYDGPKNQMRLWMDGAPVTQASVDGFGEGCHEGGTTTPWVAPVFDSLRIGWENYQSSPIAIELWIDDVAVGESAIPCPTK
jgi:hypothetical protein